MTVVKRREGYPTPNSRDAKPGTARPHGGGRKGQAPQTNLNDIVVRFATPRATDFKGPGKTPRDGLCYGVLGCNKKTRFDTPTVHGDGASGRKGTTPKYGQLNPDWEEWLMFWPVGWTDLETPNIRLVWIDPSVDPADYGEIPRITNRRDNRPARVKEIGNGQFPLTAAVAFHWGLCVLEIVA